MSLDAGCGTYAGWNAHINLGEPPCPACRTARQDYEALYRFRTGRQRHPRTCRSCGSVFPRHRCGGARQVDPATVGTWDDEP